MITRDLVEFIEKEQQKGITNGVIKSRLLGVGWKDEDIEEGFTKAAPEYVKAPALKNIEVKNIETPKVAQKVDPYRESPAEAANTKSNFSEPKQNTVMPKVWTPVNVPVKTEEKNESIPSLMPKEQVQIKPSPAPVLPPAFSPERKAELSKVYSTAPSAVPQASNQNNSILNKAIISSYPKDMSNNSPYEEPRHGVPKFLVWIFVFVVILCIGGGVAFAYINGLVEIPFLPKINPNSVTVNYVNELSKVSPESKAIPADTKDNTVPLVDPKLEIEAEARNAEARRIEELNNKDAVIKGYVSDIQLQIYKKYVTSKNKYGTVSNSKGDCVAPIKDSLFYSDPADSSEKNISHFLNPLLELEKNVGSCYSTTKSWAMSFPLATDPSLYICVDSTNTELYTNNALTGTVCK